MGGKNFWKMFRPDLPAYLSGVFLKKKKSDPGGRKGCGGGKVVRVLGMEVWGFLFYGIGDWGLKGGVDMCARNEGFGVGAWV